LRIRRRRAARAEVSLRRRMDRKKRGAAPSRSYGAQGGERYLTAARPGQVPRHERAPSRFRPSPSWSTHPTKCRCTGSVAVTGRTDGRAVRRSSHGVGAYGHAREPGLSMLARSRAASHGVYELSLPREREAAELLGIPMTDVMQAARIPVAYNDWGIVQPARPASRSTRWRLGRVVARAQRAARPYAAAGRAELTWAALRITSLIHRGHRTRGPARRSRSVPLPRTSRPTRAPD